MCFFFFFFQAEDGIRDYKVTGVQTCALPICNADLALWEPFHQEIFAVNVLTGAVCRLAHHRSQNATALYTWMPRVSVNWDGTKVAYLSNYGAITGSPLTNGYSDLWTVDVPASP